MTENDSQGSNFNERLIWYAVALLMTGIGMLVIGYIFGGNSRDGELDDYQQEATHAISTAVADLATVRAESTTSQDEAASLLATTEAEWESNLATSEAEANSDLETVEALATNALATAGANNTAQAEEAANTLATSEARHTDALATIDARATAAFATAEAQSDQQATQSSADLATAEAQATAALATANADSREAQAMSAAQAATAEARNATNAAAIRDDLATSRAQATAAVSTLRAEQAATQGAYATQTAVVDNYTPTPPPPPTSTLPAGEVAVIVSAVHEGPGEEYAVLDTISQDTVVDIVGVSEDGEWYMIVYDGEMGYVRADRTRLSSGSLANVPVVTHPTVTPMPTPSQPQAAASGQFVVVRAGPGAGFEVLGVVSASDSLDLTGISSNGHWFQVNYAGSPDGVGWISGEVVFTRGNLNDLPVIPVSDSAPPTNTGTSTDGAAVSDASTSAGATGPVEPAEMPDDFRFSYDELPSVDAYAYEMAVAINGVADGEDYQSLMTLTYAQTDPTQQARLDLDVNGAFVNMLGDDEDIAFMQDFLPLTVGVFDGEAYFYTEADEFCFLLGEGTDLSEVTDDLAILFNSDDMMFADDLPDNAVFGIVDDNGLFGIPGDHYQLLGIEEGGEIVPFDEFKVDMWWTPDGSLVYGYRITLVVNESLFFLYRDSLAQFDPAFYDYGTFEGNVTIYILPRGINDDAVEFTLPPEDCSFTN